MIHVSDERVRNDHGPTCAALGAYGVRLRSRREPAMTKGSAGPDFRGRRARRGLLLFGLPSRRLAGGCFLSSRFLTLGLVGREDLHLDQRDRAAGLLDRGLGCRRGVIDRDRELGLELAVAEETQAILGAAQNAGCDE